MKTLTRRALRVFSVLEDYRQGSADILDAILPFFEPLLPEFDGRILDTSVFAARVKAAYHWNFTADIVEELAPRFEARGWVRSVSKTQDAVSYIVTFSKLQGTVAAEGEIDTLLSAVAVEFREFISNIAPLSAFSRTNEELADILVEWLISIDAYSEDILRTQSVETVRTKDATRRKDLLSFTVSIPESGELSSEERYICARFVQALFSKDSALVSDLCRIASVGLLTEVIQDFRKPTSTVGSAKLAIYLDAPVALDLLGVSGSATAANIRPIIAELKAIGASVRIFDNSVEELKRALEAVLRKPPIERTGPTADALRRHETIEAFVREVARAPENALAKHDVSVVTRRLKEYPREHEYFSGEYYSELSDRMRWHLDKHRREHDATVVTNVMRMRAGASSNDIFQTRHLLLTKNGPLAQLARKFCLEHTLLARNAVAPAIHQRQLATAVWLRTGLAGSEQVPRRYLLAACERVLETKKSVVDQVRVTARTLTPEKAEQLELLLTQDRSMQVLMDKTLGVSNVVTTANIEVLIDNMKLELVAEITKEKEDEVRAVKREAGAKVKNARDQLDKAEIKAMELAESLNAALADDRRIVERLADEVNLKIKAMGRRCNWFVAGAIFLLAILPLMIDWLNGWLRLAALIASGGICSILGRYQLLDRPIGIREKLGNWGLSKLMRLAQERGIERKLARFEVTVRNGSLKIAEIAAASGALSSLFAPIEAEMHIQRNERNETE